MTAKKAPRKTARKRRASPASPKRERPVTPPATASTPTTTPSPKPARRKKPAVEPVVEPKVEPPAPSKPPPSEGARLLGEVKASFSATARAVGCSKALVGYWRSGKRFPSPEMRRAMAETYAIPVRAWELAAGAEVPPDEPVEAPESDDEPLDDEADTDTLTATNASLRAIGRTLRRKDLSDSARAKTQDTKVKLLALKARVERDRELVEDRIVREHPMWRRVRETILGALAPWPDAAKAVAEALGEIDA